MVDFNSNTFFEDMHSEGGGLDEPKDWMEDRRYAMITEREDLKKFIDKAIQSGTCAVDLETTGLDNRIDDNGKTQDKIVGYCLSFNPKLGVYVPVRHSTTSGGLQDENMNSAFVSEEIQRLCQECVTIWHNAKFDHEFLYGTKESINIEDPDVFEDTFILSYLNDPTSDRNGLKYLSKKRLDQEMFSFSEATASLSYVEGEDESNFGLLKIDKNEDTILWYAATDAICTYELWEDLKHVGEEQSRVYNLEKACVPAIRWTERCRPKVNYDYVKRTYYEIWDKIIEEKKRFYREAANALKESEETVKNNWDIGSAQQLGDLLETIIEVNNYNIDLERSEKSEQVKTSEDAMERLKDNYSDKFPFIQSVTRYRELTKVESTYIRPLLQNTDIDGSFIPWHTDPEAKENGEPLPKEEVKGTINDSTIRLKFKAYGTDSGRFSASGGETEHGYSGINIQSAPGCYNAADIPVKKINDRPEGEGDPHPNFFDKWDDAVENQGFLKKVYDGHFIRGNHTNNEYCIRSSCEGCPFQEECDHEDTEERRFLSLNSAFRPSVEPREGNIMAAIDFSGLEMRVAAELADEDNWKEEFISGEGDGHKQTAKVIYGDDIVNLPKSQYKMKRQKAKAANFALLYGGSGHTIANNADIPDEQGWEIYNKMREGLSSYAKWEEKVIDQAHKQEYVETCLGRKVPLHDINSSEEWLRKKMERKATNTIIQGSATGDLIKDAMVSVYNDAKEKGFMEDIRLFISLHDELVFEVREDKINETIPLIRENMTKFGDKMEWDVPVEVDVEVGHIWDTPYDWDSFRDPEKRTGLTPKPVPDFLQHCLTYHRGMWQVDGEGNRKIFDGDKLIPSDSEEYDWGACHEWSEENSLMRSFVPEKWWEHIEWRAGMWRRRDGQAEFYADDQWIQKYEEYLDTFNQMKRESNMDHSKSKEEEEDETEDEKDEEDESMSDQEGKKLSEFDYPVFTFQARINLNKTNYQTYLLRLRKVLNFIEFYVNKGKIEPTHQLRVESPKGKEMAPPDQLPAINKHVFMLLADYEGL